MRRPRRLAARAQSAAIKQVQAAYADGRRRILVANSDGVLAEDDQVRTRFTVQAVAAGDTGMQTGYESIGHTIGWELFDRVDVEEHARKVAQQALTKLVYPPKQKASAKPADTKSERKLALVRG